MSSGNRFGLSLPIWYPYSYLTAPANLTFGTIRNRDTKKIHLNYCTGDPTGPTSPDGPRTPYKTNTEDTSVDQQNFCINVMKIYMTHHSELA